MRTRALTMPLAVTLTATLAMASFVSPAAASQSDPLLGRLDSALEQAGVQLEADDSGPVVSTSVTVTTESNRPTARLGAGNLEVEIELLGSSASVESQVHGTSKIFSNTGPSMDTVVRRLGNGVQILNVLHGPAAPAEQRYALHVPGDASLVEAGAGFSVLDSHGEVLADLAEPWARDAEGRSLPTTYELDGHVLVQRTVTDGAAFPIVVDPKITIGTGVYLNMWGHELKAYAIAIIAVLGTGIAISCTLIGKLPNQVLRSLATLICAVAGLNLDVIFRGIVNVYRTSSIASGSCYQSKVLGPGANASSYKKVSAGNCT